jgi:hypothetical protein
MLAAGARYLTAFGVLLPFAYVLPIILSRVSFQLGRLDIFAWLSDAALLLSGPWVLTALVLIIARARDLPQRFWIAFCVNGVLAYISLPIYRMHFGLYR